MFNRRRLSLAAVAAACLIVASGASADPLDTFTGAAAPSHVKPSTSQSYSISLTTNPLAPNRAQRATIGIPTGFSVDPPIIQATTTAEGPCDASTWDVLIADQTIELQRPVPDKNALCPGATLTVSFDAVSAAAEGTYAWTSELLNETSGAFTLTGPQPSVVVDGTPPMAAITGKPSNPSNVSAPSFDFSADEPATFECELDGDGFAPCTSPQTYAELTDDDHTFALKATDTAGNFSVTNFPWTIDTAEPTATITGKPSNPSNSRSPSFSFTGDEDGSIFTCRLDAASAPCTSPAGYSGVGDGLHTFGVKATDPAGNTGPEKTYIWTIESRAPTAAMSSTPPGLSNSSAATFMFSADELSTFDCNLDGRGFEPCNSPATYYALGDGAHAFSVRARDAVGNLSAPVGHSWAIDTTAPETRLSAAPTSGTATSATFAFAASEGASFECRLDGTPFALCGSPKNYVGLSRGDHQFEVRAIDSAGNADATPSAHGWKITAPVAKKVASALLSPRAGARTKRPPLLIWRKTNRARYYNVQVYRGNRKVLTAWPTRARLQLKAQWRYLGRKQRLMPGNYRWFVWPGYGVPSARNYGALLGQSSFVVTRR